MSQSVVQTALKNATENPELYSPNCSPLDGWSYSLCDRRVGLTQTADTSPENSTPLTHSAKRKLDESSEKNTESRLALSASKKRLIRARESVLKWLALTP